jgi:hypothetical protein
MDMADDNVAKPGAYAATRPYVVPDSLDELTGPASGTVELPISIHWGPDKGHDLDDPDYRRLMYERVVREANSVDDLRRFLNRDLLIELWPTLILPPQCSDLWHAKFPQLAALGTGRRRL